MIHYFEPLFKNEEKTLLLNRFSGIGLIISFLNKKNYLEIKTSLNSKNFKT
jgi:hypothetical protein